VAGCAGATTAGLRGGALDAYFFGGKTGRVLSHLWVMNGDEW